MLDHFHKLKTTIYAVEKHPTLQRQSSRFIDAGWPVLETVKSLWNVWSDDSFTPKSVRRNLDSIEPFDEWEEFALFAGHYFLIVASTARPTAPASVNDLSKLSGGLEVPRNQDEGASTAMNITTKRSGSQLTPRRFGAAFALGGASPIGWHPTRSGYRSPLF